MPNGNLINSIYYTKSIDYKKLGVLQQTGPAFAKYTAMHTSGWILPFSIQSTRVAEWHSYESTFVKG